ncbi:MAG: hypothetical protein CUN56_12545 [Phototrophicales bacterium]|nr:MAG: hypothetical protein CUN56_12545 [Phototrophicales bacterium]
MDITLTRDDAGLYTLTGNFKHAEIFISQTPEHFAERIAIAAQTHTITIPSPDRLKRFYFMIRQQGQADVVVGTRRLPLQGSLNFRDLGGYQTTTGQYIKWGKIFRGDAQDRLTDDDIQYMDSIGFKLMCDLRGEHEAIERPGRLNTERLHLPIHDDLVNGRVIRERLLAKDTQGMDETMMFGSYERILDQFPQVFATALKQMTEPQNLPLAFHCTAGKDRTGLLAAMLLTLLGIPKKTIIQDYDLSNGYVQPFLDWMRGRVEANGIDFESIKVVFSAPVALLLHAYDYLEQQYGGMLSYLRDYVGIDEATQQKLQATLLTN